MWRLRRHRPLLLVCAAVFIISTLIWAYLITNIFDFVVYFITLGKAALPLSLHCNAGRLGNQMCTYATLYGISAINKRRFIPLTCNINHLRDIFVGPSKVTTKDKDWYAKSHPWSLLPYFRPEDAAIPFDSNFLNGFLYPCSYTFFDHVKSGIRKEFQFHDHLTQHAQSILHKANNQKLNNVTYVCVHVRRGDYMKRWLKVFEGIPVNMEYFEKALKYFRDKYKNVIFIAVSDDRQWCVKNLSETFGVYIPEPAPSAAHDLAIIANCNHTVLTYGTFGFWGAYLAGGEVLYFDKFLKPNTTFTLKKFIFEKMYPPGWKGVVTVNVTEWFLTNGTYKHENATNVTVQN